MACQVESGACPGQRCAVPDFLRVAVARGADGGSGPTNRRALHRGRHTAPPESGAPAAFRSMAVLGGVNAARTQLEAGRAREADRPRRPTSTESPSTTLKCVFARPRSRTRGSLRTARRAGCALPPGPLDRHGLNLRPWGRRSDLVPSLLCLLGGCRAPPEDKRQDVSQILIFDHRENDRRHQGFTGRLDGFNAYLRRWVVGRHHDFHHIARLQWDDPLRYDDVFRPAVGILTQLYIGIRYILPIDTQP